MIFSFTNLKESKKLNLVPFFDIYLPGNLTTNQLLIYEITSCE